MEHKPEAYAKIDEIARKAKGITKEDVKVVMDYIEREYAAASGEEPQLRTQLNYLLAYNRSICSLILDIGSVFSGIEAVMKEPV